MSLKCDISLWQKIDTCDWCVSLVVHSSTLFLVVKEIKRIEQSIYMDNLWIFKFSQTDYFFNLINWSKFNQLIKVSQFLN